MRLYAFDMTPIENIRRTIFRLNQVEFALICGVRQSTVSRWELGSSFPDLEHLDRLRREAKSRGLDLSEVMFFESPLIAAPRKQKPGESFARPDASSRGPEAQISGLPQPGHGLGDQGAAPASEGVA